MIHNFDSDIAKEYGLLESILLNNIWYWIEKNKANELNFYDGCYWTYNSTKAFCKLFPYASQRQIQNALKKLKELGILKTGNYNKSAYDRTTWYAFTKMGTSIMQKCKMEDAKMGNGLCKNVEPIPNNKPNNKPNNSNSINTITCQQIVDLYHEICHSYPKLRSITSSREKHIKSRIKEYNDNIEVFKELFQKAEDSDFLKGKNDNKWKANFDWLINSTNMAKVLENNYENKKTKSKLPVWNRIEE